MPTDYKEKVGKALELLGCGLLPFVKNTMEKYPEDDQLYRERSRRDRLNDLDIQALLWKMQNLWNDVFTNVLERNVRTLVKLVS